MTDYHRVVRLREDKPALQNLLQKGSIGDDIWNSFLAAEKELSIEIMEVMAEANSFVEGWGNVIFQTANEMIVNEKMRQSFDRTAEIKAEYGLCTTQRHLNCLLINIPSERKYRKKSKPTIPISSQSIPSPVSNSARPHMHPPAQASDCLVPPPNAGAESSDGEVVSSPTQSGTSRTPKSVSNDSNASLPVN
jgi:translocation protein SEC66